MVNIEKMAETAMYIVTYAGTAKSCYMNGLSEAKKGNFEKAHELLKEEITIWHRHTSPILGFWKKK